jgi:hypothetical protein
VIRFAVHAAHEVFRDPNGHVHHWTILQGALLEGTLRLADPLAVPRMGGGSWIGQIVGFETRGEWLGSSADAEHLGGRPLGVAIRGVAPPAAGVAPGEVRVATLDEARLLATELSNLDPAVCDHCEDCRRVTRYIGRPC